MARELLERYPDLTLKYLELARGLYLGRASSALGQKLGLDTAKVMVLRTNGEPQVLGATVEEICDNLQERPFLLQRVSSAIRTTWWEPNIRRDAERLFEAFGKNERVWSEPLERLRRSYWGRAIWIPSGSVSAS